MDYDFRAITASMWLNVPITVIWAASFDPSFFGLIVHNIFGMLLWLLVYLSVYTIVMRIRCNY